MSGEFIDGKVSVYSAFYTGYGLGMDGWRIKERVIRPWVLLGIFLFPHLLLAQSTPKLGIAPVQSEALSQTQIAQLQSQLQLAYERLGTYQVVAQSRMLEVVGSSPLCMGYVCARVWSENLNVNFLVFPSLSVSHNQVFLKLSLVERDHQRLVGQGTEILPKEFGQWPVLLDGLVARSQPFPTLPMKALMPSGTGIPLTDSPPELTTPFYHTWWFWTVVGAMSVLGTYAYISQDASPTPQNP